MAKTPFWLAARRAIADACDWQAVDVGLSGTGDHLATTTGRISDHDPHPAHDITPYADHRAAPTGCHKPPARAIGEGIAAGTAL